MTAPQSVAQLLGDADASVVAVTAIHCPHCRAVAPHLADLALKYQSEVRLLSVSADEWPHLVGQLGVRGTPTVMAFRGTEEIARHVGGGSTRDIERIFSAARDGERQTMGSMSVTDRYIRTGVAIALLAAAAVTMTWWLAAVGGAFLIGALYDRLRFSRPDSGTLDPAAAAELIAAGDVVVVDVRTAREVAEGGLANALHIDVNAQDFKESVALLDPGARYLLYCGSGVRSAKAVKVFEQAGIQSCVHIGGGLGAWRSSGGEIVRP